MSLSRPFNSFMARKKSRASSTDELSITKAAAWAWYQHSSGSQGKPMGEFDITRTRRLPKPSRYKLEAMKIKEEEDRSNTQTSSQTSSPNQIDDKNSLLDPYEIESISKRLDQLMESSSGNKFYDHRKKVSRDGGHGSGGNILKKKSNKLRGFWQPVMCGRRDDIAAADTSFFGVKRTPE